MYHMITVGMNAEVLAQLDALRAAFPEARMRRDILVSLIEDAHAKLAAQTAAPATAYPRLAQAA